MFKSMSFGVILSQKVNQHWKKSRYKNVIFIISYEIKLLLFPFNLQEISGVLAEKFNMYIKGKICIQLFFSEKRTYVKVQTHIKTR